MNRALVPSTRWARFARRCAQDAFENHFESHRGVWHYEDIDTLVVYSNHPYESDLLRRERELETLRSKLAASGVKILARASYPVGGMDDGYTVAVVLDAGGEKQPLMARLYEECIELAERAG